MHLPFRVDGRKALVTGGASGIGQPGAEALSRELSGASVLILDITDETAVRSAFAGIAALDILVNNAGIGRWASKNPSPCGHAGPPQSTRKLVGISCSPACVLRKTRMRLHELAWSESPYLPV
jgi:NAD(P)-dependent dehydrogenase (short-subunit alcohol dehydrogenase family)